MDVWRGPNALGLAETCQAPVEDLRTQARDALLQGARSGKLLEARKSLETSSASGFLEWIDVKVMTPGADVLGW